MSFPVNFFLEEEDGPICSTKLGLPVLCAAVVTELTAVALLMPLLSEYSLVPRQSEPDEEQPAVSFTTSYTRVTEAC